MLPGLPRIPYDSDVALVVEPRREVVEILTDDERVLYITEPVAVPSTAASPGGGGGLVGHSETAMLRGVAAQAGVDGAWTLTPQAWRLTIGAAVGDLLEWTPTVALGGGPAAMDLVTVAENGTILRALSSGTATPAALGALYTQGDYGTARVPAQRWRVTAADVVHDTVTLALAYRAGTGDVMTLGHAVMPTRITVTNHGVPGAGAGSGTPSVGTGVGLADPITWDDLGVTPGAPAPTDATTGVIPAQYTAGSRLFFGNGAPADQEADSQVALMAVVSDCYLDRDAPALWALGSTGWSMILDLKADTILYLGLGDPNEVPGNYHRVRRVAIDVSNSLFYELGNEGGML